MANTINNNVGQMMDEFPQFSKLPVELRLLVWNATVEPRVVDAGISPRTGRVITSATTPAILHVNSESRAVGLRHYEKIFCASTFTECQPDTRIYFNHEIDDLYLPFPNSPLNRGGISFRDFPILPIQNPGADDLSVGSLYGQANMRYDRAYEWSNFSYSYSALISRVLTLGLPSIRRVKRVQVDDFDKGSRLALPWTPKALPTYQLTVQLPELTEIVFRWSKAAHIHRERDLSQLTLTKNALVALDARYGGNQHGKVALRFEEVPQGRSYFLKPNGYDDEVLVLNTEHGDWIFATQAYLDHISILIDAAERYARS